MDLSNKKCIPCEVGGVAFKPEEVVIFSRDLLNWEVLENKKLVRKFKFKDFKESITFVNKVAEIAEKEGHHPDIGINYNEVNIELTTHAVRGLTENDFILASKIEEII
ncbi:MAG: 4a-hydroxytetrahydrobiopterin dehydratase [bacterium]